MKNFDLYGFTSDLDLEQASQLFESKIGLKLEKHESSYRCGEYYRFGVDSEEHFILQLNYDSFDDEWTEPDFQTFALLLYVNATERAEEIESSLASERLKLLRREAL